MSEILIAVTDEGRQYVKSTQSFQNVETFLSSNNFKERSNFIINNITNQVKAILEERIKQQQDVEKAMKDAGINLKKVFNANSITGQAYYDKNYVANLSKLSQKLGKLEENKRKWSEKQDKIYQEAEKYYREISLRIQDLDIAKMPSEIAESKMSDVFQEVDSLTDFIETKSKELNNIHKNAKKNIMSNLSDENFIKSLQSIYGQDVKMPQIIIERQGSSNFKTEGANEKLAAAIFTSLRNILSGFGDIKTEEDFQAAIKGIQNTTYAKANILGKTFNSQMKGELKKIKNELAEYIKIINSNLKNSEKNDKYINELAKRKVNELLNNLQFKNGTISFPKFTLTEDRTLTTTNAKAALGNVMEVSFSSSGKDLSLVDLLQKEDVSALFAGKDLFKRAQFKLNGKIEKNLVDLGLDANLTFSPFEQDENNKLLSKTLPSKQGKIDNIEKIEKNGKKFLIVYSDKFVDAYSGMTNVHILGGIENAPSLMNSLDLFINNNNNALIQQLYTAAISLSSASVYNSEDKREQLKQIADQVLSAHFLDIAFDASNFELQLNQTLEENGLNQENNGTYNVLYVMRVTNTYHPASHVLATILKSLETQGQQTQILKNIIKSDIQYDTSLAGMGEGSLWETARKKYPNENSRNARWGYVAAQVAENTKIKATLNVAAMNRFMNQI